VIATLSQSVNDARAIARRQLGRVLMLLAILDTSVIVVVLVLAVAWSRYHLSTPYFLALLLVSVGCVIAARVGIGIRLKRRAGNL
jgi:threonine/homoserine/homoserine lactone efflux protein